MNQAAAIIDQSNPSDDVIETLFNEEMELVNANKLIEDLEKERDGVKMKLVDNEIKLTDAYRYIEDLEKKCDKKDEQIRKLMKSEEKIKVQNEKLTAAKDEMFKHLPVIQFSHCYVFLYFDENISFYCRLLLPVSSNN